MFSCNAVGGEIVVKQGEIGENFYVIEQVVIVTTIVIVMITIFVVLMTTIMVVVMTTALVIALTTMIAIMMTTVMSSTYLSNLSTISHLSQISFPYYCKDCKLAST